MSFRDLAGDQCAVDVNATNADVLNIARQIIQPIHVPGHEILAGLLVATEDALAISRKTLWEKMRKHSIADRTKGGSSA